MFINEQNNLKKNLKKGTSIMEAVAFGGKEASDSSSGTVILYFKNNLVHSSILKNLYAIKILIYSFKALKLIIYFFVKDWSNLQFSENRIDTSNRVSDEAFFVVE